jgi:hypothetical protein
VQVDFTSYVVRGLIAWSVLDRRCGVSWLRHVVRNCPPELQTKWALALGTAATKLKADRLVAVVLNFIASVAPVRSANVMDLGLFGDGLVGAWPVIMAGRAKGEPDSWPRSLQETEIGAECVSLATAMRLHRIHDCLPIAAEVDKIIHNLAVILAAISRPLTVSSYFCIAYSASYNFGKIVSELSKTAVGMLHVEECNRLLDQHCLHKECTGCTVSGKT